MLSITKEVIENYQRKTFLKTDLLRLQNVDQAVNFVNERGFILFHPAKDVLIPSLWVATAGERPVPNEHDDPGHITWEWKDTMLDKKVWYYARLLNKRMSILSLSMVPYFYALTPNYGDWKQDYLEQYEDGVLSYECKMVYEALLFNGPMNTLDLRDKAGLWGSQNQSRYTKALNQLQEEMKILPVGIAEAGRWKYAFIFDIAARYYTDLSASAGRIKLREARASILEKYLHNVGAATERDIKKVLGWSQEVINRTSSALIENGKAIEINSIDGMTVRYLASVEILI